MPVISQASLHSLTASIFSAHGCNEQVSERIAQSLVHANLCGHDSHGVARVPSYVKYLQDGILSPTAVLSVENETDSLLVTNGQLGFGQVQMPALIEKLTPKAQSQGIACGVMNQCGHIGQLSQWVEQVARMGFAAMLSVNDNGVLQAVAPPGGTRPTLSTNPIAIATPGRPCPMVVDISTSIVANGKILVAHQENKPVSADWLLDSDGNPTTDPGVRYRTPPGSLRPAGGYKGFGLAFLLDILVSGLTGGYCPPPLPHAMEVNNVLMLIWDPNHFHGTEHLIAEAKRLEQFARASPTIDANDVITLPHDRSRQVRRQRTEQGIPLGDKLYSRLADLATQLNLQLPEDW